MQSSGSTGDTSHTFFRHAMNCFFMLYMVFLHMYIWMLKHWTPSKRLGSCTNILKRQYHRRVSCVRLPIISYTKPLNSNKAEVFFIYEITGPLSFSKVISRYMVLKVYDFTFLNSTPPGVAAMPYVDSFCQLSKSLQMLSGLSSDKNSVN